MDKIKQAAIILLGMGDRYAAEILKSMDPKRVSEILDAINNLGDVTEVDVIQALNAFFKDASNNSGIDIVSREMFKTSVSAVVENKKYEAEATEGLLERAKWVEEFKHQPPEMVYPMVQDEHPQVLAALAALVLNSEKASKLVKNLPKELQGAVIARMAGLGSVSTFGMDALAIFFEKELHDKGNFSDISVNGVETVANIISYLDMDSEKELFDVIAGINAELSEIIQEHIMPFERLAQLDKRSLQTLLSEVDNEDLVLALKGAEPYVKASFLKNMATKSAEILNDELESKGPVKVAHVIEAQKRIITLAKKLASEDKIIISTKVDSGVVF